MITTKNTARRWLCLALAALLCVGFVPAPAFAAQTASERFSDVAADGWYAPEVQWALDEGVMHGYGDGSTFGVGENLTRAEFAAVLANHAGADVSYTKDTTGMSDLAQVDWYTGVCNWAVENGYIKGYEGKTFGPNDPVTREMAMVILARYAGAEVDDTVAVPEFPDSAAVSSWATASVAWAIDNGVVTGAVQPDGSVLIQPGRNVLREEIAKMLHVTSDLIQGGVVDPDPTEPVDPANPTLDPSNPTDPVNPGPAGPTDPVDPDPTDPVNPGPTDPVDPDPDPDDPVDPKPPVDPVDPPAPDPGDDDGPEAFAVYSADDKSLTLYKRDGMPKEGDMFEGKIATEVHEGVENRYFYLDHGNNQGVRSVVVADAIRPYSTQSWFSNMENCEKMDLAKLDMSRCTSTANMFFDCKSLEVLDLSGWDVSEVKDMDGMFGCCLSLEELDLSDWDVSRVENMRYMFSGCSSLRLANGLEDWDVSSVRNMGGNAAGPKTGGGMFSGCSSLEALDLSKWNVSSVEDMNHMFSGCSPVESFGISGWDVSKVRDMSGMFSDCKFDSPDLSSWDVSSVRDMNNMFSGCEFNPLGISGWNVSNVSDMSEMFSGCSSVESLDLSGWDVANVEDMYRMFYDCTQLESVAGLAGWNVSSVEDMGGMFACCSSLESLDLSKWKVSNVHDMGYSNRSPYSYGRYGMFGGCSSLVELNLKGWDTSSVTNMSSMFSGCSSLESLVGLEGWDTPSVTDMGEMFYGCSSLDSLDLSEWDASSVTNMYSMCICQLNNGPRFALKTGHSDFAC